VGKPVSEFVLSNEIFEIVNPNLAEKHRLNSMLRHLLCYCCTHRTGHNWTENWIRSCSLPVHIYCKSVHGVTLNCLNTNKYQWWQQSAWQQQS